MSEQPGVISNESKNVMIWYEYCFVHHCMIDEYQRVHVYLILSKLHFKREYTLWVIWEGVLMVNPPTPISWYLSNSCAFLPFNFVHFSNISFNVQFLLIWPTLLLVTTRTDHPTSVRNRCVIDAGGFVLSLFFLWMFCWWRGFYNRTWSDIFLFLLYFIFLFHDCCRKLEG